MGTGRPQTTRRTESDAQEGEREREKEKMQPEVSYFFTPIPPEVVCLHLVPPSPPLGFLSPPLTSNGEPPRLALICLAGRASGPGKRCRDRDSRLVCQSDP